MAGIDLAAIADRIQESPARLGRTRLVLVDGPSGAGKTTLAYALAGTVPVELVHTDDLVDGWDDQFTYWNRLERLVLGPIRAGRPGRYQAYDWYQGRFDGDPIEVPAAGVLVVEGVGAGRARARAQASLSLFVDAPLAVREARSLARDGPAMQDHLREWRRREDLHFAADATRWCCDLVVDGGIGSAA
jgi:uridine kinase